MVILSRIPSVMLVSLMLYSALTQAVENGDVTLMNLHGVLLMPICEVNNGQLTEIGFGSVGVNKISDGIFRQPMPYFITCDNMRNASRSLKLGIYGNTVSFDSDNATLATQEQQDLGIKIYQDGKPMLLNTMVKVDADKLPALEAVIVQREGASLTSGKFKATATIKAEYF